MSKKIKNIPARNYLAKDFDSFRAELLQYAQTYFPDQIKDFSEASLGGLLLDMPSFIGDTLAFYLDHQFRELDYKSAVEIENIETHLKNAGVKPTGKAPSSTSVTLTFIIDAETVDGDVQPTTTQLPKILQGTTFRATNGVTFTSTEDIDFKERDFLNQLRAEVLIDTVDVLGQPSKFKVSRSISVIASKLITETFNITDSYVPFRKITLSNLDINQIVSVYDSDSNEYIEVEDLSQDTVYESVSRNSTDQSNSISNLRIRPAPYRFVLETSLKTRLSTLMFGSGDAKDAEEEIVKNPAELALPLVGTTTFSKFSVNPNQLLKSKSLGYSPRATVIEVTYYFGGGLNTNVAAETITSISALAAVFDQKLSQSDVNRIRGTALVTNQSPSSGGSNAPTVNELRDAIPGAKSSQNRIVTRQDLLARVYTFPSVFGRVFKVGVNPSLESNLASNLYILSKDANGNLITCSDNLKLNLRTYLNEFRLISESVIIKDADIINFKINFTITTVSNVNKLATLQEVAIKLIEEFDIGNFEINQEINLSAIKNAILNTRGVRSLANLELNSLTGDIGGEVYSSRSYDFLGNTLNDTVICPEGSIFELKNPLQNVIGNVI